jgi:multidrug efflux pump
MMTSFAFILGVLPLARAAGAGAEIRQVLGTAVFAGMLGVTLFGLFLTPTFYVVLRGISQRFWSNKPLTKHGHHPPASHAAPTPHAHPPAHVAPVPQHALAEQPA